MAENGTNAAHPRHSPGSNWRHHHAPRANVPAARPPAGRYSLQRQKHNFLFSARQFHPDKYRSFDYSLLDRTAEAVAVPSCLTMAEGGGRLVMIRRVNYSVDIRQLFTLHL